MTATTHGQSQLLTDSDQVATVREFVKNGIDLESDRIATASDAFWMRLRQTGTELWLDTGNIDAAGRLWTAEFSALTTNNTLLNKEVQKGIYDELIVEASNLLGGLEPQSRVIEIAFILNARHGLKLVQKFGGMVSVELHTDMAHDTERTVAHARRFHDICPSHFVIKVPLTPAGLIATRRLRDEGIPVNFTLGFSARQNYLATAFAGPSYVNVFLGRLNAYVADNNLGDGRLVGEKATLASQRVVKELSQGRAAPTRQIAASLRAGEQVLALAGVDVHTIPTAVAEAAWEGQEEQIESKLDCDYEVELAANVSSGGAHIEKLWEVAGAERELADSCNADLPASGEELVSRAHDAGVGDLFPRLDDSDLARIADDGKIPKHEVWSEQVRDGRLAVDTLLNLAGLAAFATDQAALDERIRRLVE